MMEPPSYRLRSVACLTEGNMSSPFMKSKDSDASLTLQRDRAWALIHMHPCQEECQSMLVPD